MQNKPDTTEGRLTTQDLIDYIEETRRKNEQMQAFESALQFIQAYRSLIDNVLKDSQFSKKDAKFFLRHGIQWILNNNPMGLIANLPTKHL